MEDLASVMGIGSLTILFHREKKQIKISPSIVFHFVSLYCLRIAKNGWCFSFHRFL